MRNIGKIILVVIVFCLLGWLIYFFAVTAKPIQNSLVVGSQAEEQKRKVFQNDSDIVEIDESKDGPTTIKITGVEKKEKTGAVYHSKGCKTLKRTAYIACYNPETKVSDWTMYDVSKQDLVNNISRTDDFRADPAVEGGQRAELSDYRGSGYDRGHLVPAADMARSETTMSESFLLTNIGPQEPKINRGIWRELEEQVRKWAGYGKSLRVITGPMYFGTDANGDGTPEIPTIGKNKIFIPSHYFKIILETENPSEGYDIIAFAIPNWEADMTELSGYLMSVDNIENITGMDFFSELDDAIEVPLESKKHSNLTTF